MDKKPRDSLCAGLSVRCLLMIQWYFFKIHSRLSDWPPITIGNYEIRYARMHLHQTGMEWYSSVDGSRAHPDQISLLLTSHDPEDYTSTSSHPALTNLYYLKHSLWFLLIRTHLPKPIPYMVSTRILCKRGLSPLPHPRNFDSCPNSSRISCICSWQKP